MVVYVVAFLGIGPFSYRASGVLAQAVHILSNLGPLLNFYLPTPTLNQ